MNKADHRTPRDSIGDFQQIVNIGSATAEAFRRLGLAGPQQLIGQDPFELYEKMCRLDGVRHDPCVLDVFMATIDYMNGNPPHQWWHFTADRNRQYGQQLAKLRNEFCNDAGNQA